MDAEDRSIQRRFIGYLQTSISRHRWKYIQHMRERGNHEIPYEAVLEQGTFDRYDIADRQLLEALDRLTGRDRHILLQRAVAGESFVSIAGELGITAGAAKAAYRRALEKIRKELEPYDF